MNIYYAKSILYAYPCAEELIYQIDEIVEKRALGSMTDFSPAEEQCEKILSLIGQKDTIIKMKLLVEEVLNKFTEDELKCLDYKYFHKRKREEFINFDASSRGYFRKQIRIAEKFAMRIEKKGLSDSIYEKDYLSMNFFRELYRRVLEQEAKSKKNKIKSLAHISCRGIISTKLPAKRTLEIKANMTVSKAKINTYS